MKVQVTNLEKMLDAGYFTGYFSAIFDLKKWLLFLSSPLEDRHTSAIFSDQTTL
jgi:hypothetical protein